MIIKNNITTNNNKNYSYIATECGRQAYEQSVLDRMNGRAGAYTQTGSKGIAFEVMANDLKNLTQPGTVTKCTVNSTARQLDAVTLKGNKIVERIQYKDTVSPSGVRNTVKRMANGQYQQATMYGTKETAALVNERCASQGVSKTMHSMGISSETTARMGDKFLGNMPSATGLKNVATSSAALSGGLTAGVEIVKSIANGDSAGECANHVVTKGAENMISAAVGSVVTESAIGAAAGISAMAALPAAPVIMAGTALGIGASMVAHEVVDGAFGEFGDAIEEVVDNVSFAVEMVVDDVVDTIESFFDGIFGFW
ncbi:MAG: hypothetical protein Q4C49_13720 [Bacillota bacterium]|nr:hypothetical protein [Bacillota bacterium]